jgi:cytochrome c-type biogenesis protein
VADVPYALALLAGAVAAVNPCGFALLPAYLAVLVADPAADRGRAALLVRALRFSAGMTAGFVAVFGVFGALVAPIAVSVERWLPAVTVVMGLVLVLVGLRTVAGRGVGVPGLAGRGHGPTASWSSQVTYGAGFALASLSCTVAPFLAVSATALRVGSVPGVVATFVLYAVGMGSVVLALSVAVALARGSVATRVRRAGPVLTRVGGALLVLAGAYVAWYGVVEVRVLSGDLSPDPLVGAVTTVQAAATRALAGLGAGGVAVLAAGLAVLAAAALLAARRRTPAAGTRPRDADPAQLRLGGHR